MPRFTDTIAALATPAGTSAIALLRVSGPDTERLAREIFGATPPPRHVHRADYRDQAGNLVDDVLSVWFKAPHSYTGEDSLEVSCHGNPFIAQKILEDLLARGCRAAEPGEFTQRAFLNGRMDLSQAEAVMDVIHARSERALAAAHRQLRGALGRRVNFAVEQLLGILAHVEAYIDFPDEDLPAEDRKRVGEQILSLIDITSKILSTSHYGDILRDGIKTVIVGKPNVGKSSLLNRMVGHERALVSPEAGTTRDFLEERIMVGPHCLRLIDTAGLNRSPTRLEKLGMEKTLERLEDADLAIVVVDGSADASLPAEVDLSKLVATTKVIVVVNKSDFISEDFDLDNLTVIDQKPLFISAKTGEGFEDLEKSIVAAADQFRGDAGEDEVAINARHAAALETVIQNLKAAWGKLEASDSPELLASDLRAALEGFGEIAGRIDHERMLDHLFASFCIGK